MAEVFYVRNTRPNAVLVRLGDKPHQTKYVVERRGSREDTTALPADAIDDPTVARFIQRGIFEVITKDQFMRLGERSTGRPSIPLVERSANQVALPMGDMNNSRTPTIIADEDIKKFAGERSPNPEFVSQPKSTEDEIAQGIIEPRDPKVPTPAPTKEQAELNDLKEQSKRQGEQIEQLLALLQGQQAVAGDKVPDEVEEVEEVKAVAPKKPAARKAPTTRAKSTKATPKTTT